MRKKNRLKSEKKKNMSELDCYFYHSNCQSKTKGIIRRCVKRKIYTLKIFTDDDDNVLIEEVHDHDVDKSFAVKLEAMNICDKDAIATNEPSKDIIYRILMDKSFEQQSLLQKIKTLCNRISLARRNNWKWKVHNMMTYRKI
ncbi:hypothetical protein DMUE_0856 [Dictyocoela muelleri]|nr:hypothetical protein DMUE_0856 [Dictyocoela muelleri]